MNAGATIEKPIHAATASVPATRDLGLPSNLAGVSVRPFADPMDEDEARDDLVLTSERRLLRLVTLAADVGARFEREGIAHDPVAWMLAPRALFDGGRALEAGQDRDGFVRATLLHGLGLGLDASAGEIDLLLADDDDASDGSADEIAVGLDARFAPAAPRLFVAEVHGRAGHGGREVQAFCATVAADEAAVRRRLGVGFGAELAAAADVREGFDPGSPLAGALLSGPVAELIAAAAADPSGPLAAGLDVRVERRVAA